LTFMDLTDIENNKKSMRDALPRMKSRMKYIMDQALLAGGRVEAIRELSGSQTVVQTSVNPATVIQSSLQALDGLVRQSGIPIDLRFSTEPCEVIGNAKQLEIVFVNLIKNAIEAMNGPQAAATRRLGLSVQADGVEVVIEIADSGPGILVGHTPALFRSHFTTKGAGGTGMGLYIARQIVRGHGGTMDVKTELGKGTTFTIRLRRYSLEGID
jgi:signal transduction histidine kinase